MNAYLIHRAKGYYDLALKSDGSMLQEEAAVMNHAFACELALKGMADAPENGHDLLKLFEAIPKKFNDDFATDYKNKFRGDLLLDLASCRNLFVDLRYYHEKAGYVASFGVLKTLACFLTEAGWRAVEARPDREVGYVEMRFPQGLRLPGAENSEG